jgi:hypothetical protein
MVDIFILLFIIVVTFYIYINFYLICFLFSGYLVILCLILHCKRNNKAAAALYHDQFHETESNLKKQSFHLNEKFPLYVCHCCPILTKTGMCWQNSVELTDTKFNGNLLSALFAALLPMCPEMFEIKLRVLKSIYLMSFTNFYIYINFCLIYFLETIFDSTLQKGQWSCWTIFEKFDIVPFEYHKNGCYTVPLKTQMNSQKF